MIWNTSFDVTAVDYGVEYENSLHFSQVFEDYAARLATRLAADHRLEGRRVVDIGAGKGDFLALLCQVAACSGTGFDPGYEGTQHESESLRFVRAPYSDQYSSVRGDLVVCRHVLEHVVDPRAFAATLREAMTEDGALYVEVPSAEYMLLRGAVWDVVYEHVSYFTAPALRRLLEDVGLEVVRTGTAFGDQYLWAEAVNASKPSVRDVRPEAVAELVRAAQRFGAMFRLAVSGATREVARRSTSGPIALWGAGSKGVTFLNVVDRDRHIGTVVDSNPRKQGRHVPGSGQEIVAPSALVTTRPASVLVTNPLYSGEVQRLVDELGVATQVVVV